MGVLIDNDAIAIMPGICSSYGLENRRHFCYRGTRIRHNNYFLSKYTTHVQLNQVFTIAFRYKERHNRMTISLPGNLWTTGKRLIPTVHRPRFMVQNYMCLLQQNESKVASLYTDCFNSNEFPKSIECSPCSRNMFGLMLLERYAFQIWSTVSWGQNLKKPNF